MHAVLADTSPEGYQDFLHGTFSGTGGTFPHKQFPGGKSMERQGTCARMLA